MYGKDVRPMSNQTSLWTNYSQLTYELPAVTARKSQPRSTETSEPFGEARHIALLIWRRTSAPSSARTTRLGSSQARGLSTVDLPHIAMRAIVSGDGNMHTAVLDRGAQHHAK